LADVGLLGAFTTWSSLAAEHMILDTLRRLRANDPAVLGQDLSDRVR
jgi:hypothetical protein